MTMLSKCLLTVPILVGIHLAANAAEPLIVAHRGLLRHAPENTLANFRAYRRQSVCGQFARSSTKARSEVGLVPYVLEIYGENSNWVWLAPSAAV